MAPAVYVWPMMEVGGLFSDMHVGNPIGQGFDMSSVGVIRHGNRREVVTVKFNLDSTLSPTGHINLEVAGRPMRSIALSERDAAMAIVDKVRRDYQFVSVDYSLVRISENRALFNALRAALLAFRSRYDTIESCIRDTNTLINEALDSSSAWLLNAYRSGEQNDVVAALAFHCHVSSLAGKLSTDISHARSLVDMMISRDSVAPHGQAILDQTVQMPMVVPWENSAYTLRSVYNEAIKKLGGVVSEIEVEESPVGLFVASVRSSAAPYEFIGAPGHNQAFAKATLCYSVIDHVHQKLGFEIHDLHYPVLRYQTSFIRHYDQKVAALWRTGQKLNSLFLETETSIEEAIAELGSKLSPLGEDLSTTVQLFSANLRAIKLRLEAAWPDFSAYKVDKDTVQSTIINEA